MDYRFLNMQNIKNVDMKSLDIGNSSNVNKFNFQLGFFESHTPPLNYVILLNYVKIVVESREVRAWKSKQRT